MAFPTTSVLDNFNRGDGDVGANWGVSSALIVSGNKCIGNGYDNVCAWIGPGGSQTYGTNQECFFTVAAGGASADMDIILKSGSATNYNSNCIEILFNPSTGAGQVDYYNGGWGTVPSSTFSGFQVGDQLGAQALSTGHIKIFKNGTEILDVDANTVFPGSNTGYIGVWCVNSANGFDDFGGGDIVAVSDLSVAISPDNTANMGPGIRIVG